MDSPKGVVARLEEISKAYGDVPALTDITMTIRPGTIHVLLGPNGAGKTTVLNVVLGFLAPDTGTIVTQVVGEGELRIGYQAEIPVLYEHLTVRELMHVVLEMAGIGSRKYADGLLHRYELTSAENRMVKSLSAGTRRKLAIVAALAREPNLLILDEPTNGLDTTAVYRLKQDLGRLCETGTTIILSTHILDFAMDICDDVTLLRSGRLVYSGPATSLPGGGEEAGSRRVARLLELDEPAN